MTAMHFPGLTAVSNHKEAPCNAKDRPLAGRVEDRGRHCLHRQWCSIANAIFVFHEIESGKGTNPEELIAAAHAPASPRRVRPIGKRRPDPEKLDTMAPVHSTS